MNSQLKTPSLLWIRLLYGFHSVVSLAYEILWIKMLAPRLGMSTAALGTVLACFVSGLGIGGMIIASWSKRKSFNRKWIFVFSQLGLAVWAGLLPHIMKLTDYLYVMSAPPMETAVHHLLRLIISIFLLLIPSILIGLVFPLLGELIENVSKNLPGQSAGQLDKDGLLWAPLGCLLLPAFLTPWPKATSSCFIMRMDREWLRFIKTRGPEIGFFFPAG